VDIAAPGYGIYSTVLNPSYDYKSGTSMAAPHVAAVAAMVIGKATITVPQGLHLGIKMGSVHQIAMGKDDRLRARSHFVIMELCTIYSNRRHCAHLPRYIGMANSEDLTICELLMP